MTLSNTLTQNMKKCPFFPIPKLRRHTHSYCTKCGISKEYYSESICSECGNTTFSDMDWNTRIPTSKKDYDKWKKNVPNHSIVFENMVVQSKTDFLDDFDDSITMANLFGHK